YGYDGNDRIFGASGNDHIYGGHIDIARACISCIIRDKALEAAHSCIGEILRDIHQEVIGTHRCRGCLIECECLQSGIRISVDESDGRNHILLLSLSYGRNRADGCMENE
ncbi:MAG: hypothetical protein J5733_05780, partial [Bacteroidaceae bacterium]|nr:hypothetical protein [Bacteroidaceae bacterium]